MVTNLRWESGGGQESLDAARNAGKRKIFFHRAVVQSGPGFRMNKAAHAEQVAEMLLTELGLSRGQLREGADGAGRAHIVAAQAAVQSKLAARVPGFIQGFSPVMDGVTLPTHPFDPTAPDVSADVPLIIRLQPALK